MLVRVLSDSFCAGFVIEDDRCVLAAPILRRWLMGKTADECRKVIRDKGWLAHIVKESEDAAVDV